MEFNALVLLVTFWIVPAKGRCLSANPGKKLQIALKNVTVSAFPHKIGKKDSLFQVETTMNISGHLSMNNCFKSELDVELADGTGRRLEKRRGWSRRYMGSRGNDINFSGLEKCVNYTFKAFATLIETGERVMVKSKEILIPPDPEMIFLLSPKSQTFSSSRVSVGVDEECRNKSRVTLNVHGEHCEPPLSQEQIRITKSSVTVGDLLPGKTVQCFAYAFYHINGKFSDHLSVNFSTNSVIFSLKYENNSIRIHVNDIEALLKDPKLAISVVISTFNPDNRNRLEEESVGLETASSKGFGNLKGSQKYKICLKIRSVSCDTNSCAETFNCKTILTKETPPSQPPHGIRAVQIRSRSLIIEWNKPKNLNGPLREYRVNIQPSCVAFNSECPCKVLGRFPKSFFERSEHAFLFRLEPYTRYFVKIKAYNNVGSSPWSNETSFVTLPELPSITDDMIRIISLNRSFEVRVTPPCPAKGPMQLQYFKKNWEDKPEFVLHYDPSTEFSIAKAILHKSYKPFTKYNVCVKLCPLEGCQAEKKVCKKVETLEDCPDDAPEVLLEDFQGSSTSLTSDKFQMKINPPRKLNGNLVKYITSVKKLCPHFGPTCRRANSDCNGTLVDMEFKNVSREFYLLENIEPFTAYSITVRAQNSITTCTSPPSATRTITTRPSLRGIDPSFSVQEGSSDLNVIANSPCPYPGALKYSFALYNGNHSSASFTHLDKKELVVDESGEGKVEFKGLPVRKAYKICLETIQFVQQNPSCLEDNENKCSMNLRKSKCKLAETKCFTLKPPKNIPHVLKWSKGGSFDPFHSVKLLLPAHTFDGKMSAIDQFTIFSVHKSKLQNVYPVSANISYDKNSTLTLKGLEPGKVYQVAILAQGCENKAETDSIFVETEDYKPPTIGLETELFAEDMEKFKTSFGHPKYEMALFKVTESEKNVLYAGIQSIKIGLSDFDMEKLLSDEMVSSTDEINKCRRQNKVFTCYLPVVFAPEQPVYFHVSNGNVESHSEDISHLGSTLSLHFILIVVIPACSGGILVIIFLVIIVLCWQKKKKDSKASYEVNIPLNNLHFTQDEQEHQYEDLVYITENEAESSGSNYSEEAILSFAWVSGHLGQKYLSSQGFVGEENVEKFWKMVVNHHIAALVILGQLKDENGIQSLKWPKPGKSISLPQLGVVMKSIQEEINYEMHGLTLAKVKFFDQRSGQLKSVIPILHYQKWQNQDHPESAEQLIDVQSVFRNLTEEGNIMIYSLNDDGRNGIFMALDTFEQQVDDLTELFQMIEIVARMSRKNSFQIKSEANYRFLHKCFSTYIKKMKPEFQSSGGESGIMSEFDEYIYSF